jgi:predicted Zn-dependent protease
MKPHLFSIAHEARLVIYISGLLLCGQHVWASDVPGSQTSNAAEATSSSVSPTSQIVPPTEAKTEKSGKYDVDRIGERSIGRGLNLYSLQKERAIGESMASAIDRSTRLVTDPDINDYINQLGQKIARNSDAAMPFTIKVIDSPDVRVFGLPGGFLYVDKGLIMELDSEAELAGLMAHEIAHVAARHATRFATRRRVWNMLTVPLGYVSGPAAIATKQIGPLTTKKFSRDSEFEADLLGIEYQYAAGYDPEAFVEALEKLHSKAKAPATTTKASLRDQIARAFASYPPTEERIQKLQTVISTLLPNRNDYVLDTSQFQEVKAKVAWADRPILRRHRDGTGPANGPVLHRSPSQELATVQAGR